MRVTIQGQNNQLPHPVYLPPVHIENTKTVGGNQDVILTIPGFQGFKMIVKANSVTFPDGSTEGELVVNPVHNDRLPMVPPGTGGRFMATGWTLQPSGTRFDPPIEVHIPNTDGLKPGTTVPIVQWDHDMAYFVPMGQGTISEDGTTLISNQGSGITKAGWGGGPPPIPPNEAENECEIIASKALAIKATGGALITANGDTGDTQVLLKDGSALVNFNVIYCGKRTVEWDFGDGGTSAIKSPPHTYTEDYIYEASVIATCITPSDECKPTVVTGNIIVDVVEPCKMEEIEGECIAEYGKSLSFSTDTNYTDRTEWNVEKGGNPDTFTGEPFDAIFGNVEKKITYSTKLEAVCKAELEDEEDVEISIPIMVGRPCSDYEPFVNNLITDNTMIPSAKDLIKTPLGLALLNVREINGIGKNVETLKVRGCVSSNNKWEFRFVFPNYIDKAYVAEVPREQELTSSVDSKINGQNCFDVLEDLTPSLPPPEDLIIASDILLPPFKLFVPTPIIRRHENVHISETRVIINTLFAETQAKIPEILAFSTDCGESNPFQSFLDDFNVRKAQLESEYYGTTGEAEHENRAYRDEIEELAQWRSDIRDSAFIHNWPEECQ